MTLICPKHKVLMTLSSSMYERDKTTYWFKCSVDGCSEEKEMTEETHQPFYNK